MTSDWLLHEDTRRARQAHREKTRSPRRRLLQRHLDTTLVLTNPSETDVVLDLTLYDAAGEELGTDSVPLSGHRTKVLPVSNLLP